MALEIIWRNPLPPAKIKSTVQRVALGDLGAVYAVCTPEATEEFELILGGAA